ncbi:hypothetical protein PR202_gb17564 [Eleusine coracana subsp. coracana]|uniref:Pantothenate kinase n=1 Tax=Eleusine coracana subsp. coracana TaxID=191504 RepID=A0AAV5F3B6_ELECO|nr:hypothetical protein PR202_gb17564 [Eleusine coracana subsp. coracana]
MDRGRVTFDFTGAEIRGDLEGRNPPIFLPCLQTAASPLVAIDIGGTLIKLAYTASCGDGSELRFATFEKHRLDDCFEFIQAEGLVPSKDDFLNKLHVHLDKLHEFECLVSGANVMLKNIPGTAFTYMDGKMTTVDVSPNNLFPYLIVNIGTCVAMIKVTGNKTFEFVTTTNIGGAFVFGLAKLLTGCNSYDEFLQLCQKGDNSVLDLFVKDICGELISQKVCVFIVPIV